MTLLGAIPTRIGPRPRPRVEVYSGRCLRHDRIEQCVICAYVVEEHPDDHEAVPVEACYRCGRVLGAVRLRCTCPSCDPEEVA